MHVDQILSSTRRRSFGRFNRSPQLRRPVDFDNENDIDSPTLAPSKFLVEERPAGLVRNQRRASTGTRAFLDGSPFTAARKSFQVEPVQPLMTERRRVSLEGTTRPCMERSNSWMDNFADNAPVTRRRTSLGTRPSMDGSADDLMAFDRPLLRPYRQLSSEDLCIGEETDEDLSNRSMLRTTDASNRSNRSAFRSTDASNRSNRSAFLNNEDASSRSMRRTADVSNRSNRSAFTHDFSNRSYRTTDDISIRTFRTLEELSIRSNRTGMDINNLSNHSLNFSNHSVGIAIDIGSPIITRGKLPGKVPEVVTEGNEDESTVGPQLSSPLNEEEEFSFRTARDEASYRTAKDEASYRTTKELEASVRSAYSTQPQEPEEEQQQPQSSGKTQSSPSKKEKSLNCRPEPWPVDNEALMKPSTVKEHQRSRPTVSKSNTWPNNLMALLTMKRLSLKKNPSFVDGNESSTTRTSICSFEESDDSFSNKDVMVYEIDSAIDRSTSSRQRTQSNSPVRNRSKKFLRAAIPTSNQEVPPPPL